ncbi:MAG: TrbI/VirB10 family protein [Limnohabitans sp.]|jgi:type IV secretion system protein VirB10|uniref:TrbI/VirB10 family protein n=1 Tax=Limnohabitans sp. TaxID=1907725 RepID=UPI0025DE90A3|nr:TrbI/VirB10 family protein [Limnohabitans sp.]MCO4087469.1 TrbI/VirB10 family protein [Limnohabitans sp.]
MTDQNNGPKIPQARASLQQPQQAINADFDDVGSNGDQIQRGIAPRTLKRVLSVIAIVLLLGWLFWPEPKKTAQETNLEPPLAPTSINLVDDVLRNKEVVNPGQEQSPTPPVSPSGNDFPLKNLTPPLPTSPPTPSLADEREEMARLSGMDATDVTIRKKDATKSQDTDVGTILLSSQAKAEKMMEDAQKFAEKMALQGDGKPASNGSSEVQSTHARFLSQQNAGVALPPATQLNAARSVHTLYEGTIVRTVLTRALKTDLPGTITAKVSSDLYDSVTQRTLLVPRGSEITCSYQSELMVGQALVLAACSRIRLPNGKSFALSSATASDMQGASGLPAEINNHFWKIFKTALIVGAVSKLLPTQDQTISSREGVGGQITVSGTILGQTLNRVIQSTIARNLIIPPTGSVAIGTPFTLTLSRDVELEPYLR